ncbi:chemotaxis protein CheD [Desulfotomaculum arcticum]|uniref:Probable chemoreceptor glutamine deamidase CheD n=1 Tax=Desulfotruncus arcticus DSM 17038 TaxID=1121424 RepID=A0A1I2N4G6_9FIRM|nr:chemotaxis protein CheD [Desulfotruncus arcticus]SFF96281.1 chemotaxis protein CheD [Desulfotomaculum arcticum] [Desulfotruncus arcticus DSM 17038]
MDLSRSNKDIHVGIGEYKIALSPNRLVTLGLGSCVGVSLWDPSTKIGGLLHIMLPNSRDFTKVVKPEKYADLGIPLIIKDLVRQGAGQSRLVAKLVGGAQMFTGADKKQLFNIGERNIEMSRKILKEVTIRITAEEVGGNKGRTMYLDTATGEVLIRTIGKDIKVI